MFSKLNHILSSLVLLIVLFTSIASAVEDSRNTVKLPQPQPKNSKQLLIKLSAISPKDNISTFSLIPDEYAFLPAKNPKSFKPNLLSLQTNSPYINTPNKQKSVVNKDKIKLERLDKVNTLEKSLGKSHPIKNDYLNPLPASITPNTITIHLFDLIPD